MITFKVKHKVLSVFDNDKRIAGFSCYDLVTVKPILTGLIGIDKALDAEDYFKSNCVYLDKKEDQKQNEQLTLF